MEALPSLSFEVLTSTARIMWPIYVKGKEEWHCEVWNDLILKNPRHFKSSSNKAKKTFCMSVSVACRSFSSRLPLHCFSQPGSVRIAHHMKNRNAHIVNRHKWFSSKSIIRAFFPFFTIRIFLSPAELLSESYFLVVFLSLLELTDLFRCSFVCLRSSW
jgi:hypothetical protein